MDKEKLAESYEQAKRDAARAQEQKPAGGVERKSK